MVNKIVDICDGCGKRTADKKCCWCDKDLCSFCGKCGFDIRVSSTDICADIGEMPFCKNCKQKLIKLGIKEVGFFDNEFGKKVEDIFRDYLNKIKIMDGLKK